MWESDRSQVGEGDSKKVFGRPGSTDSWLKRLDTDESLEQAVSDDKRTGRKRKLSESQQEEFEQTVHESPEEVGIDAPALVQEYLEETYGVEYSSPSCRRLLKEAGGPSGRAFRLQT